MSEKSFDITFLVSFFIILIISLFLDLMDFIWELAGFPLHKTKAIALSAGKAFSASLDGVTSILIGGWLYWIKKKGIKGSKSKFPEKKSTTKKSIGGSPSEVGNPEGRFNQKEKGGQIGKSVIKTIGMTVLGEVLPIIGMAPFWTLTVIRTFIKVINEK